MKKQHDTVLVITIRKRAVCGSSAADLIQAGIRSLPISLIFFIRI